MSTVVCGGGVVYPFFGSHVWLIFFFTISFFLNVHKEQGHFCNQKSLLVIIAGHQTGQERSGSRGESLVLRNDAVSSLCKF